MPDQVKGGPHELTEAQKKLVAEDPAQTLDQQENMKISGSNARHMVMQKLMRKSVVRGTGGRGEGGDKSLGFFVLRRCFGRC